MRLDDNREIVDRVDQVEETFVAVAMATGVVVLVKPVLMLDMDRVGLELPNLGGDDAPPVAALHVDQREHAVTLAVGVADDEDVTFRMAFLDELPGLFAERGDPAEPGRVRANHYYRGRHSDSLPYYLSCPPRRGDPILHRRSLPLSYRPSVRPTFVEFPFPA